MKIIVGVILIIISVYVVQAVAERTGLISEGLLLGFIFLMLGALFFTSLWLLGRYFEKELNLKKQKEA